jgi:hypothetical protein
LTITPPTVGPSSGPIIATAASYTSSRIPGSYGGNNSVTYVRRADELLGE